MTSAEVAVPDMLILGRESRGLSQEALAAESGVSQAYISKGENDLIEVTGERFEALAEALGYPIEFFLQHEHVAGVDALFHRRLRTVKVGELKQLQAQINVMRVHVKRLMRGVTVETPYAFPRVDVDEVGGPERAAQLVRRAWRLPLGPVSSVVASIEAAGGVVVPIVIRTDKVSAAAQWPLTEDRPYFFVNAGHGGERQRFSLAHEIAHMVLHSYPVDEQEDQADRFASEFLMPEAEIRPQLKARLTLERLGELKRYWKVSIAALIKRASQLGIIDDKRMTSFYKMLAARGWRKVEPLPIKPEKPTVLQDVIDTHQRVHKYSLEELSKLARLKVRDFVSTFGVSEDAVPPPTSESRMRLRVVG